MCFICEQQISSLTYYLLVGKRIPDLITLHSGSTSEPVSFPEQTLSSGKDVSQPPVQKYGTVCRLHSDYLA